MSKSNPYKKLVFQTIANALSDLNAEDRGRYFICNCPECNQHEAFMYKNNTRFIQCNRENHCGSRMMLEFYEKEDMSTYEQRGEKQYPDLTTEQRQDLDWSHRVFSYAKNYFKSEMLDNGYRGLSKQVTRDFVADLQDEAIVQHVFQKAKTLLNKDYSNNSWMCKRNLIFPLYSEDNTLDRVLLRSSIDENLDPKEIQLIFNPSKETRDFFMDIPQDAENVVISESILDALSFREIDENVGIMALTGATKTRQVKDYLAEHKEQFADKQLLIAMDDDQAGWKATQDLVNTIEEAGIGRDWSTFAYSPGTKDANENLQQNRKAFTKAYEQMATRTKQHERVMAVEHEP
ncbi:toprim domain-containing protein [Lentibacillus cibarius]|uniref:Toprim domain-containing protein n=1 Tax=Lentibacillus cibarius TaxID=2583219 RepID=A0A549YHT0_9BACI|nr:toprim domain-containing protein [Lentibacillus cibarius]TRM11424.1 toprim domain-containing protein [Lentibacillus cibarius]